MPDPPDVAAPAVVHEGDSAPAGHGHSGAIPAVSYRDNLLSIPDIRQLWIALSLSTLGGWLGLLAATALAATLATSSYLAAGAAVAGAFAAWLVPALVLGPVGGMLADRLDRRWTMVIGDLIRCALFVSVPLVGRLWWLFVAAFLASIAGLLVAAARVGVVAGVVPRERRDEADRLGRVTDRVAAMAAGAFFALLALVAAALGTGIPFFRTNPVDLALYVTAATFLFAAVAAVFLPVRGTRGSQPVEGAIQTLLASRPTPDRVSAGVILALVGTASAGAALIGAARIYVRDLGGSDAGYGVLFAAVFAGLALGVATSPRLLPRLSRRRMLGLAGCLVGAGLAVLALVPNVVLVVFLALLIGFLSGVVWTTALSVLRSESDGQTLAYAQSAVRVVVIAMVSVVPLLAGVIGAHRLTLTDAAGVDYNGAAIVLVVVGLVVLFVGLVAYQRIDDRRGQSLTSDLRTALRGSVVPPTGATLGGYLIAFEGGEGAGKSSQAERLASFLIDRGHDVVLTFEPGSTPVGRMLRMTLLDPDRDGPSPRAEALLYAADRADHVDSIVRPALERGAVVITDRYTDSSVAYQGAGRALPAADIARLSEWATDALVPDVTVLLDVPPEIGLARRGAELDRLESEPAEFHDRVRDAFLDLAHRNAGRYVVIDAALPFEEAAVRIRQNLQDRVPLSARERLEIEERWRREDADRLHAEHEERRLAELEAERRRLETEEARQRAEAEAASVTAEHQRLQNEETHRLARDDEDRRQRVAETEASRQRLSDSEIRRRVAREEAFRYLYADTQDNRSGSPLRTQEADLADEILGAPEPGSAGRSSSEGRHRAAPDDSESSLDGGPAGHPNGSVEGNPDEEHTQRLPRIDP